MSLVSFGATNAIAWSTNSNSVSTSERLSSFSFTSSYAPVYGPYALGFSDGYSFIGDPGIPGSPLAKAAGFTTSYPVAAVPEPENYGMMLGGLALICFMVRRKKSA
ncbi:MAG: PEP-CTERM sorting domain-containing protein [Glaciimonas sp.]|nr:PEP-CTERM sorting domain-containing protein [Glaciimonas sp.]